MGYFFLLRKSSHFVFFSVFHFYFYFFFFKRSLCNDGVHRRLEKGILEFRQSRKKRRYCSRTRQQELDENGQRLRALQQNLHFHGRRHHFPKILRQQGQAHHVRRIPQVH